MEIKSEKIKELLESIYELKQGIIVYCTNDSNENIGKIIKKSNWDTDFDHFQDSEDDNKKVRGIKAIVVRSTIDEYYIGNKLLVSSFGGTTLIHDKDTLEELILIKDKDIIATLK